MIYIYVYIFTREGYAGLCRPHFLPTRARCSQKKTQLMGGSKMVPQNHAFQYYSLVVLDLDDFGYPYFRKTPVLLFYGILMTNIHTYIHTDIQTYRHTYIRTYIHTCITLHYTTLHYIKLHYITLHHITLHYVELHYITLHTYIYIYMHIWVCQKAKSSIPVYLQAAI